MDSCLKAVIEALGIHLKENMPRLKQVIYEFPAPGVKLLYPTLSIIHEGNPLFTNLQPYELEKGAIANHKAPVQYVVGQYELRLQLDLWCGNKEERYRMYDEFFQAFNKDINPMGLSLKLSKYHNLWTRFDQVGQDFPDNQEASQTSEWRARVSILAHCKAVLGKVESIITEPIENNLDVTNNEIVE